MFLKISEFGKKAKFSAKKVMWVLAMNEKISTFALPSRTGVH
jgi:ABC-type enterochelin transport system substrate-binding protein